MIIIDGKQRVKKSIVRVFFLFLIALSLLLSVSAQDDFSARGFSSLSACPCIPFQSEIQVKNTGSVLAQYVVEISGDAARYVVVAPRSFMLEPGNSIKIFEYANPPCGFIGEMPLFIDISSQSGLKKRISQSVKVNNCLNSNVTSVVYEQTICPGGKANYEVRLSNIGLYTETYTLGTDTFEKYAAFQENPLVVLPGETKNALLAVQPSPQFKENYKIDFFAASKISKIKLVTPLYLYVSPCFNYSFAVADALLIAPDQEIAETSLVFEDKQSAAYSFCTGESRVIPLKIANTADFENEFYFSLAGNPSWITIDSNYVKLMPKQVGRFNVLIAAPQEQQANVSFSAESRSVFGEEKQRKDFQVTIVNCFAPVIGEKKNTFKVGYEKTLTVIPVQNAGSQKTQYGVDLITDEPWISVDEKKLELESGQTESLHIRTAPSEETLPGKYAVKIVVTSKNGISYERDFVVDLRQKNLFANLFDAVMLYKWYILAAIIIIVVFAVVLIKRKSLEKKEPKKEKPEVKRLEREAEKRYEREEVEVSEKKEGKEVPKKKLWPLIVFILLALAASLVYYYREKVGPVKDFTEAYVWYILAGIVVVAMVIGILVKRRVPGARAVSKKEARKEEFVEEKERARKEKAKEPQIERPRIWPIFLVGIIILAVIVGVLYFISKKIGFKNIFSWIIDECLLVWEFIVNNALYVGIGVAIVVVVIIVVRTVNAFQRRNTFVQPLDGFPENEDISFKVKPTTGIGEIALRLKNMMVGAKVVVKGLATKPTFIRAAPLVYKYIEIITPLLSSDDYVNIKIRFLVSKQWLEKHDVKPKEVVLKKYAANKWEEISTKDVDEDPEAIYYEARLADFSYFAVCVSDDYLQRMKEKKGEEARLKKEKKQELKLMERPVKVEQKAYVEPKIIYEVQKEKVKQKAPVWPLWILSIILLVVMGNILYTNWDVLFTKEPTQAQNETIPQQEEIPKEIPEEGYHTDQVLDAIENGGRYKYNQENQVVDTATGAVLSKKEFADIIYLNQLDIVEHTDLSPQAIMTLIRALDPERVIAESVIPPQAWNEDETLVLHLDEFIKDPDGDKLYFEITNNHHVMVEVDNENSIAVFTPEPNWFGQEKVSISADDLKNGTLSTELLLIVRDVPEPPLLKAVWSRLKSSIASFGGSVRNASRSLKSFFMGYYGYILGGLVILIIIILFIRFNEKILDFLEEHPKKKEKKK